MRLIDGNKTAEKLAAMYSDAYAKYMMEKTDNVFDNNFRMVDILNNLASQMINAVMNAPTIDAVEVVRCKDCVDHQRCRLEQRLGWYGYCSDGEVKT